MPFSNVLSEVEVFRLPPMIFGRIRWKKHLGAPVGDPATCFMVLSEEHTVSQFRMGASGPEECKYVSSVTPPVAPLFISQVLFPCDSG